MVGRKAKLNKQSHATFMQALDFGMSVENAAKLIGVSRRTVYDWIGRGEHAKKTDSRRPADKPYIAFADDYKKAQVVGEFRALSVIRNDPSWQSKAWWLERSHPQTWALTSQIEKVAEEKTRSIIEQLMSALSPEAQSEVAACLLGASASKILGEENAELAPIDETEDVAIVSATVADGAD